ncbi:MAG TPA: acyltransferase [Thermoanaerobaculia bacterium]|nr:acyltransferase [Thermoanaerobaculia bacterium]
MASLEATSRRVPELDGIRGMAILLVLIWHYVVVQQTTLGFFNRVFLLSWSGVDLFFVLSGFLIGGILMDHRLATNYFQVFYVRRICRILPLYFLWIFLFVVVGAVAPLRTEALRWLFAQPLPLWSYATFTQNIVMARVGGFGANWLGVTWSLAVEEQFYLALPLMIRFIPPRRLPLVLITMIVAAPVLRIILVARYGELGHLAGYVLTPCRADALLLGALCAHIVRDDTLKSAVVRHRKIVYAIFAGSAAGVAMMAISGITLWTFPMTSYGFSLLAVFYASLLLIVVIAPESPLGGLMRNRGLRRLGIVAYAAYMFHQGVSGLCYAIFRGHYPQMLRGSDAMVSATALLVTLSLAGLSWVAFERPILRIGHRFQYQD